MYGIPTVTVAKFPALTRIKNIITSSESPWTGAVLLIASFAIGLLKVYYGRFVDEADNLTLGWLITRGYSLYRDVFSHHFPFPYYWAAFVVSLFGNSFIAVRISVLALQIGTFALNMKLSRSYLGFGLTSLLWNLTNQFFRGQEAIYPTFESIFMIGSFSLIFLSLARRQKPATPVVLLVGVYLGLALLTDPLMIYPSVVAIAGLFTALFVGSPSIKEAVRKTAVTLAVIVAILGVYATHLVIQNSVDDFYRDTIWFNREIYSKYEPANPLRTDRISQQIIYGLKILDPRWTENVSPFLPLTTSRSVKLENEPQYNRWVFSALLFRMLVIAGVIGLVLNRNLPAAVFVYLFAAASLVREGSGFYAMLLTMVSLVTGFYTIIELRRPDRLTMPAAGVTRPAKVIYKGMAFAWTGLLSVLAIMLLWSAIRGGFYLMANLPDILNGNHVKMYNNFEKRIREITCEPAYLELAVYPINPIVYFVTQIPPATKYTFMYPWVAEIGQQEVIADLRENSTAVVWLNTSRGDGEFASANYLADTIEFLNDEYVLVDTDLWISPELASRCLDPSD